MARVATHVAVPVLMDVGSQELRVDNWGIFPSSLYQWYKRKLDRIVFRVGELELLDVCMVRLEIDCQAASMVIAGQ